MTRILVVEDSPDLALGLQDNLEIEGYEAFVAADGASALNRIAAQSFDLVVLDLMLPDTDGFRVLRSLRSEGNNVPVLVLTARGEEADKVRGLRLGADDYVTKPFSLLELLARVAALLRRSSSPEASDEETYRHLQVRRSTREVRRDGRAVALTPKEYDLLVALIDGDGSIRSRQQLMEQVWGYNDSVITRTIDTHIGELRKKLERTPSQPELILTVRSIGYRWALPRAAVGLTSS